MWGALQRNRLAAGAVLLACLAGGGTILGRVVRGTTVGPRELRLVGEYRGVYAGDCVARLLLRRDGVAEYRDGCGGQLEFRAEGTWKLREKVVRFAWRDEPRGWTSQKRRGVVSDAGGLPAIELDFVHLAKLRRR